MKKRHELLFGVVKCRNSRNIQGQICAFTHTFFSSITQVMYLNSGTISGIMIEDEKEKPLHLLRRLGRRFLCLVSMRSFTKTEL